MGGSLPCANCGVVFIYYVGLFPNREKVMLKFRLTDYDPREVDKNKLTGIYKNIAITRISDTLNGTEIPNSIKTRKGKGYVGLYFEEIFIGFLFEITLYVVT